MPVTINGTTGIAGPDGSASTPAVQGTDSNTGLFYPAADTVALSTGGSERMRVTSGGNLLVGTTSTSLASATTGTGLQYIPNNAVIVAANGGNSCLIANKTDSTAGSTAIFRYNGSTVGDISITSTNAAYNTASSSTNGAQLNYQGITFPATQSASSDANTLDDYEEGTWTPSIGGTATYTARTGTYRKIGSQVTCWFDVTINAVGTGSGALQGLPFANNASAAGGGNVGYFASLVASFVMINPIVAGGQTSVSFETATAATATIGDNQNIWQNSSRCTGFVTYHV